MAKKSPEPVTLAASPEKRPDRLRELGGSLQEDFNRVVIEQALSGLWLAHADAKQTMQLMQSALTALTGIAPRDELEGMLAVQMIAAHSAAMEAYRRAMLPEQTFAGRDQCLKHAAKLSRIYLDQLAALDKRRGKGGQQLVRVEHVTVNGNAVVGINQAGGGPAGKTEDQPHARQLAHAPVAPLSGAYPAREPLPIAGGPGT